MSETIEILKDDRIQNKWHRGFGRNQTFDRKGKLITTEYEDPYNIILHGTGGGDTYQGLVNWVLNGGKLSNGKYREKEYKKGIALFHYIIDRRGNIVQIINPNRWIFHSSCYTYDRFTIAVEMINPHPDNKDPYTIFQYESLFYLIFEHLFVEYPISVISTHKRMAQKYSGIEKNCPGNFDFDMLESEMKKRKYKFQHNPKYQSYWGIR